MFKFLNKLKHNLAFIIIMAIPLSSCNTPSQHQAATGPSQDQINALNSLVESKSFLSKTEVIRKGQSYNSSCKGSLCSAFGVESVSSSVTIDYLLSIEIKDSSDADLVRRSQKPIYLLVDHRLNNTIKRSGGTTKEEKTLRRKNSSSCANEPWMYVIFPANGYSHESEEQATVTIKRTYAPGSSIQSFETTNVDGAISPILRASFSPFRAGRHDCWDTDFAELRP